jgi:hypothetical protein
MALIKVKTGGVDSTVNFGRRNMIINGAMQVAQRGTSATTTVDDSYLTVDRWQHNIMSGSDARFTMSQATDAPNGFNYSLKYETTTAEDNTGDTADGASVRQKIEKQDLVSLASGTSDAKPFTISFWVKSNKTGTFTIFLQEYEDNSIMSRTYTINSANTWEYKTVNVPAITDTVITSDNSAGMQVFFGLSAGTSWTSGTPNPTAWASDVVANRLAGHNVNIADTVGNTWQITGLQLEVGDTATPFEHRSYGEELSLCQRYFQKISGGSDAFVVAAKGQGSASIDASIPLTVPLRASPTMNSINSRSFNDAGFTASSSTTPTALQYSDNNTILAVNCGGFTGMVNNEIQNWGPVSNVLTIDAEL